MIFFQRDELGLSYEIIGKLGALGALLTLPIPYIAGMIVDRIGFFKAVFYGQICGLAGAVISFFFVHGMWSMFQTVGWANKTWYPRLKMIANIVSTLMMLCFAAVVVIFYLRSVGVNI